MDLYQQRHDVLVKQVFGHAARLAGTIGSPSRPGRLEILVDGKVVGSGPTFASALQAVTTRTREAVR